jgi:hypothetical protein
VIFSLFARKDSAKVATGYALDADLDHEASFIDGLLRNLPVPWLAPYLNLIAGHRKLCDGRADDGRRQLARARDGGHPLIRVAALHLLDEVAFCSEHRDESVRTHQVGRADDDKRTALAAEERLELRDPGFVAIHQKALIELRLLLE